MSDDFDCDDDDDDEVSWFGVCYMCGAEYPAEEVDSDDPDDALCSECRGS